ncbi:MAG: tetratricopeptide repeat-containing sulfotransferase family protein [Phycisphaerales bacterium JB040]
MTPPPGKPADAPPSQELLRAQEALRAGRYGVAADLASQARRKNPSDPRVLATLGQALARSGNPKTALQPLARAVKADPGNLGYRYDLAFAYDETARSDEALREIDRMLEEHPGFDRAIQLRCSILRRLGRTREAWEWLAPRLDELARTPAVALAGASVLPREADPAPVLERVREAVAAPETPAGTRRSLFYALAKLLDRAGACDEAFAAMQSANRLFPQTDLRQHHTLIERMTPEILASIEPADVDGSSAVLVCGMPRSGTTLTEQILSAHPRCATVGESPVLGRAVREAHTHAQEHGFVPRELSTKLARRYLRHLREDGRPDGRTATRVVDKMPQNIMYLGVVDRLLPGCRVIRCTRDPRDTALSCYMQDFHVAHPYRSTFESLADEMLLHEEVWRRWKAETGLALMESRLEDLTADPRAGARGLVEFAGLAWDEACLRFHETAGHVKTASVDQVRTGINTRGHGRWQRYEKYLRPLIERLAPLIEPWDARTPHA